MSLVARPGLNSFVTARGWGRAFTIATRFVLILVGIAIAIQTLIVVEARPQDLITGVHGMADLIRRAMPPDFSKLPSAFWPTLQTVDIALFGTFVGIILAVPLALLAAANMTPSRYAYYAARAIIGFTRAVPDLVWALLFVTAVGLGHFPAGWRWVCTRWVCSAAVRRNDRTNGHGADQRVATNRRPPHPSFQPWNYSDDPAGATGHQPLSPGRNICSSFVLGFVGAGGIGFQLLTAMNLFHIRKFPCC